MVRWHHQLHRHEFEQTSGNGEGQGSLACVMGSQRVGHNWVTEQQHNLDRTHEWWQDQTQTPWILFHIQLAEQFILTNQSECHACYLNLTQLLWSIFPSHRILKFGPPGQMLVAQMVKNLPAMQKTWVQFLGQEESLENGMAPHSSILIREIPWTEEPGGLQSMGVTKSWTWLSD